MKSIRYGLLGLLGMSLCLAAQAQSPIDLYQTWSAAGLAGWTNTDGMATLSNPGGYLNMAFSAQTQPKMQMGIAFTNIPPGLFLTNIAFTMRPIDLAPSAVRLYIHSSPSDHYWFVPLEQPETGVWTTVSVPVAFSAHWGGGPNLDESAFRSDMLSVDWVGVYIRRNGSESAQNYGFDNFLMQGIITPPTVSISGSALYAGLQTGPVKVLAESSSTSVVVTISAPGAYTIDNLPVNQSYTVSGYRDSNGNDTKDLWEAAGTWSGNPARPYVDGLTGADFTLTDPTTADGLPYWWVYQYFGVTNAGDTSKGSQASEDVDGDGRSNYQEYRAGTDPTNALSQFTVDITYTNNAGSPSVLITWGSIPDRLYDILRSSSIGGSFAPLPTGTAIPATPPKNTFEDLTATGRGPYFYRVLVEP